MPHLPLRARVKRPLNPADLEDGFILVAVLWTIGLLALVAIVLARTTLLDVRVAANLVQRAEAESLSDGLARLVAQSVVLHPPANGTSGPFRLDGRPQTCSIGGARAAISIYDAGGQFDLNFASQEMLENLLVGVGVVGGEAKAVAGAIVDFRSPDGAATGADKVAAYRAARLPHGPKGAPFISVGELDQVLGMTPALFRRLHGLVTVHSRSPTIDENVASPEMLATGLPQKFPGQSPARAFLIRASIGNAHQAVAAREMVIELAPRLATGYSTRNWTIAMPVDLPAPDAELVGCLELLARSAQ